MGPKSGPIRAWGIDTGGGTVVEPSCGLGRFLSGTRGGGRLAGTTFGVLCGRACARTLRPCARRGTGFARVGRRLVGTLVIGGHVATGRRAVVDLGKVAILIELVLVLRIRLPGPCHDCAALYAVYAVPNLAATAAARSAVTTAAVSGCLYPQPVFLQLPKQR
jgi:hypothetical protein